MATGLRYPFHEHPLIPRELSINCTVHCNRCANPIRGSTHCCLECEVFFHERCTEWPFQVHHPSHPRHLLTLVTGNSFTSNYCCHECGFSARAEDVVSTLPPADEQKETEGEEVVHFGHEHPLTSFTVSLPNDIRCGACKRGVSGRVYGCRTCMFLLHESCGQVPQEIQHHPFHNRHSLALVSDPEKRFKCKACGVAHEFAYHCNECGFDLDVLCAVSTLLLRDQQNEDSPSMDHFSHPHQLKPFTVEEDCNDIACKACKLHLSGEVYGCLDCIYFLHGSCTELHSELVHSLHPDHFLVLQSKSRQDNGRFRCSCCSQSSSGFVYSCDACNFNLDVVCALETLSALEAGATDELQHFAHDHLLSLRYIKGDDGPDCNACKQPVHGLCYCCLTCKSFVLHQSYCHTSVELKHPFHPEHSLTLLSRPPGKRFFYCHACNRKSTGFTYHCAECDFFLDMKCASLEPTVRHQLHEHSLTYFERATGLLCFACGRSCNTDLYRCVLCNFNLHHDCLVLPLIQHGFYYHPFHPLTLSDKFVIERFDEQYCDACEKTRNPDHGVYLCEECDYAAHIPCVIKMVQAEGSKPIQNSQLGILEKEIASLKAAVDRRAIKLERLMRKRGDTDLEIEELEERTVHETSKEEVQSEESKLDELKKLDEEIASLEEPMQELKQRIETMRWDLRELEEKQVELMRKRDSLTTSENKAK